jgi:hypothetical protein
MDWRREASISRRHDLAGLGLVVPPTVFALGVLTFGCAWSRRCCELKGCGGEFLQEPVEQPYRIESASADRSATVVRAPRRRSLVERRPIAVSHG